jgi:hypothetical protein
VNSNANVRIVRYTKEMRAGLVALSAPQVALGLWAVFAPRSWFDDFPGGGRHWVSALGPYNEHLSTDVGAFFLAIGVLLLFAAFVLERRLVQAALGALLVYSVPHLVWHLGELGAYGTLDKVLNLISLSALVVVPLLMLPLTSVRRQSGAPAVPAVETKGAVTYGTR